MKWPAALDALLDLVAADPTVLELLGGAHVYRHAEYGADYQVPGIYYTLFFAGLDETTEPMRTQWDIYALDEATAIGLEQRLRKLLHWMGWRTIGDVSMSSLYQDSRDHPESGIDTIHRSLDFRHAPVRNRGW